MNYTDIKLSDFQFWKYDFLIADQNVRTLEIKPRIREVHWFTPIRFSHNNSLVVIDVKGKTHWIKQEFWDSSSSPFWKVNDKYGIMVRLKCEELNFDDMIQVFNVLFNKDSDE